jgi:antitoxin component YwqK of YwqJK toxin-antitoxin module
MEKIERTYHSNGELESEVTLIGGKPHGVTRRWHANGVLESESPVCNGLANGVCRRWNADGKLLGEFELKNGTGTFKEWYPDGRPKLETTLVNGIPNGRMRMWGESGDLFQETYLLKGKPVSKKKYADACKKYSALPTFPSENDQTPADAAWPSDKSKAKYRKGKATSDEKRRHSEIISKFRGKPNQAEAREWLKNNAGAWLGEFDHSVSLAAVEDGYQAGALKIVAADIQKNEQGIETSDHLLVDLPSDPKRRKRIFTWSNQLAMESGFDGDRDWGQSELFILFD